MEREIMFTGIGGQGVQLSAQILARAAVLEGRHVMTLGTYGGTMRGGNTENTVVVADEPIGAPPIVARTWSALAMHHRYWDEVRRKLRPDAVVVLNSSLFEESEGEVDRDACRVFDVPATDMASDLGGAMAASQVLLGAYARLTGLAGIESLVEAMRASVPAYRREHLETNERALRAGFDAMPEGAAPAWSAS